MAASSSLAKETAARSGRGQISVTNTATPSASGTASTSASSEETTVPYTKGRAPNSPETGSHALPTKNLRPNSLMARREPWKSSKTISTTMAMTLSPQASMA